MNRKEKINVYVGEVLVGTATDETTAKLQEAPKPVFLSDRLIQLGRAANSKNNRSMAAASEIMHSLLVKESESHTQKQLFNITKLACDQLNKEGYPFYKVGVFFDIK